MPRFFVGSDAVCDKTVRIVGDDAFHIARSLRMRVGETVTVCDDGKNEYTCSLTKITDGEVVCEITDEAKTLSEPPYDVTLYQALCKGDKFDTVVQKAVETGVTKIVPVLTSRCTVRPDKKALDAKLARWSRIAAEASKQSGRGIVVPVMPCIDFAEAVKSASACDLPVFCYEDERKCSLAEAAAEHPTIRSASIFVGPEGGFDKAEAKTAAESGMISCSLGRRILRTETASTFVLSCLAYEYELKPSIRKE